MRKRIINFFKNDWKFKIEYFGLMIMVLLIATTLFRNWDYSLQTPGSNIFANITYIVVIVSGLIFYYLFQLFEKKNFKIEKLYIILVLVLGIMYCIANPIGKIPDEDQHARKSYMISQGVLFAEKDEAGKAVGMINSKINELASRNTKSYEEYWEKLNLVETDEDLKLNYSMETYAPICHAPQALGMAISRVFGGGISVQCYVARIFNLLVSAILMYWGIKLIPFKKHIVFFLGLLPITISEFASMSSDALTIASCVFYICYILYLKYDENKNEINKKDIIVLSVMSIVISLMKIVYVPLVLLIYTLPKDKFNTKKERIIVKNLIVVISILINILWLSFSATFLTEANPGVNGAEQVKYILTHPISYILILFRTIHIYNQTFLMNLCGEGLGHYDSQASVLFTLPCLIIFAFMFFVDNNKGKKEFDWKEKLIYLLIFIGIVLLVYTSLYVAWTPVNNPLILGVQSRYFLPVLLLMAIVLDNRIVSFNKEINIKYISAFMLFINLNALSNLTFMYIYNYIIEYYIK